MLKHTIAHDLDRATLDATIPKIVSYYRKRFPFAQFSYALVDKDLGQVDIRIFGIDGRVQIKFLPGELSLAGDLPLTAIVFRDVIVKAIAREAGVWLEAIRAGRAQP